MKQKYLDLAGLTVYDGKLKEWIKSSVVDITDDEIRALFVAVAEGPADNEIWYTTEDGLIEDLDPVSIQALNSVGLNIISNTYTNGIGKLVFDNTVEIIPTHFTVYSKMQFNEGYHCNMTSVTLPNKVKEINWAAFTGVITLPDFTLDESNAILNISYYGTIDEWNQIKLASSWNWNTGVLEVQCIDGAVTVERIWGEL